MFSKTISIIELDYHAAVLYNFCKMVEGIDYNINVFTTDSIWKKVNLYRDKCPQNIHLYLKSRKQSTKDYLNKYRNHLDQSDVLIFNTIASNFRLLYKLDFKTIKIARVHNSNTFFNSFLEAFDPKCQLFFIWKDFSYIIRKVVGELEIYYKNKFLKTLDYYAFPATTIRNYTIKTYQIPHDKALAIPFSFSQNIKSKKIPSKIDGPITITVIGKVDFRNRDYNLLIKAFRLLLNRTNRPIKLILLGKANSQYGRYISRSLKKLKNNNFSCITFEGFVEQNLFNQYIDQTDFLILPLKKETRFNIFKEYYGYTKISGAIDDIIVHQKPALITNEYPLEDNLSKITETFSDEKQLANKLYEWVTTQKFIDFPMHQALHSYQLANVQNDFIKLINSITKQNLDN